MKTKPITPCPLAMMRAGIRLTIDAAVLVHLGRVGLSQATVNDIVAATGQPYASVQLSLDRLRDLGLIVRATRTNRQGRAYAYCASVRGWELLTAPADFSMFQQPVK